jgi:hypothetical protein
MTATVIEFRVKSKPQDDDPRTTLEILQDTLIVLQDRRPRGMPRSEIERRARRIARLAAQWGVSITVHGVIGEVRQ